MPGHSQVKEALAVVLASVFAMLLAASAFGQIIGTNIPYAQAVWDYTTLWSTNDPYAFQVTSNLQTQVAGLTTSKVSSVSGALVSPVLYGPTIDGVATLTNGSTALAEGQVSWDSDNHTLAIGMGNDVVQQVGQELPIPVENRTGAVITNGMCVAFAGTVAASGRILVRPFVADNSINPNLVMGMVTSDDGSGGIANNGRGFVTWFGKVRGRDTTGAFDGEYWPSNGIPVYASTNRPGFLTVTPPQAPHPEVTVGYIAYRSVNQGMIDVKPHWHCRLQDLDDVDGTPLTASGQLPVWNQSRGVWDFTANINAYASTAYVASAVSALALSNSGDRTEWMLSNAVAMAWARAASNAAAGVVGVAASASNTAASAFAAAVAAGDSAAVALSLASTYYGYSTNALQTSVLAYDVSTNALAVALAIRAQNEYPTRIWTDMGGLTPGDLELPEYMWLQLNGVGSNIAASAFSVSQPTNVHWQTFGSAVLINDLTSDTNALTVSGYHYGLPWQVPEAAGLPVPLPPVSGASDSWEWDQNTGSVTNRYRLSAVTNAAGVALYLALTNRYTGYVYGSTNISASAYTNTLSFQLLPLVDGVTGSVQLTYWREAATTGRYDFAEASALSSLSLALDSLYNDWNARTITFGGVPGSIGLSNLVFSGGSGGVTNETDALALAELSSYAATNQVRRWYASPTNWLEYSGVGTINDLCATWRLSSDGLTYFDGTVPSVLLEAGTYDVHGLPFPISVGVFDATSIGGGGLQITKAVEDTSLLGVVFLIHWGTTFSPSESATNLVLATTAENYYGTATLYLEKTVVATYYLPTNMPLYAETWSYTQMTNWMADGNAGQLWASSLATDAANTAINGHLAAPDPHAYTKRDNGVATNLTLVGAVTLTNATSFAAGVLNTTNGVYFTRSGTNYWILLP